MENMYKVVPNEFFPSHKFGSVYFLQAGIPTTNTIMRHTLMPKSGDDKMIRGYSINMLHHLDTHTRFRVMDLKLILSRGVLQIRRDLVDMLHTF